MRNIVIYIMCVMGFVAPIGVLAQDYELEYDTVRHEVVNHREVKREGEKQVEFRFKISSDAFDTCFADNAKGLVVIDSLLGGQNATMGLDSVVLHAKSSIDGLESGNIRLAKKRVESVRKMMMERFPSMDTVKIVTRFTGEDWGEFRALVEADSMMPYKTEVMKIIDQEKRTVDSREWLLRIMRDGKVWTYMKKHVFPVMRSGASAVVYHTIEQETDITYEDVVTVDTVFIEPEIENLEAVAEEVEDSVEKKESLLKFALKTNLLFDALIMPNIELEMAIGKRWSIAGEWMCPWWVSKDNGNALQIMSLNIDGKYWFGKKALRAEKPALTGWYAGLYVGGGLYDVQYKGKGYQGEFYVAAGLSAGYAHTINKRGNLRMEYSLGVGFMRSNYRYYEGREDNDYLVWQHDGTFTWLGPTKAKVSFVWLINDGKGGKR